MPIYNLNLSLLVSLWFLSSCVSLPQPIEQDLPITVDSLFGHCTQGDGALVVQVYEDDRLKASGELEWVATSGEGWQAEFLNPIGQAMLTIAGGQGALDASGPLASRLPPVGTDSEGFVLVDGYFVAFKASEIPCFLNFRIPRTWLQRLTYYRKTTTGVELAFQEQARRIETKLRFKDQAVTSFCSTVTWSRWWGLSRHRVQICSQNQAPKTATIEGLESYKVKWIDANE